MTDLISRQAAIDDLQGKDPSQIWDTADIEVWVNDLPPAQPEQAVKDCRTCKHGKYNDYHDTYFCYNAEDCSNWDKWETSAQPEQRWIPCEERLPEEGQLVLTTIRGTDVIRVEDGETFEDAIDRSRKIVRVSVGFIGSDGWYGVDGYPEIVAPCAWMPLPEPYREEGEAE